MIRHAAWVYRQIFLLKKHLNYPSLSLLAEDDEIISRARTMVSYFYFILPYLAFLFFIEAPPARPDFDPLWPLFWLQWLPLSYEELTVLLRGGFLIAALAGMFMHRYFLSRFLICIMLWQAHALDSSFGQINHSWYLIVYATFLFLFLPKETQTKEERRKYLLTIWATQALVMLAYTMAGAAKIVGSFNQFLAGQLHGFAPDAFAYQIAAWLPKLQEKALLGPFIVEHPLLGWPFYVGLQLLQFFALWTMIRPSLQRVWAFLLLLFHVGTYLTMGIVFNPLPVLLILLFFHSPFTPKNVTLRHIILDLPVIGPLLEMLWKRPVMRQAADR